MLDRINKLPKYKFFDVLNELFENEKKIIMKKFFLFDLKITQNHQSQKVYQVFLKEVSSDFVFLSSG